MARFQVRLHGQNLTLGIPEFPGKVNFFTTRYIDASDEKAAVKLALESVGREEKIKRHFELTNTKPEIEIKRVEAVPWYRGRIFGNRGFTFYAEEP